MLKNTGKIKGFYSSLLSSTGLVDHHFCSRLGGVSKGVFSSLNLSAQEGDEGRNVLHNRKIISEVFGFPAESLVTLKQVHGNKVLIMDGNVKYDNPLVGDGIVTHDRDFAIGVLTADCLPILILEPTRKVIGALHGGWRGLVKEIVEEGISVMEERYAISRDALLVAIGPFIKKCCYTVGKDIMDVLDMKYLSECLIVEKEKMYLDLETLVVNKLENSGVMKENIEFVGPCTSCDEEHLFSYRRDGKTGRQLSFIKLC